MTDAIALNLDLPATFLDWAGVEVPERYQGRSLQPIVASGNPTTGEPNRFTNTSPCEIAFPRLKACETIASSTFATLITTDHEFLA